MLILRHLALRAVARIQDDWISVHVQIASIVRKNSVFKAVRHNSQINPFFASSVKAHFASPLVSDVATLKQIKSKSNKKCYLFLEG